MSSNNQSNRLIKWLVIIGDFILLSVIIFAFSQWHWRMNTWPEGRVEIFILVNNIALMLSEMRFSTVIHLRLVGAGVILQRLVGLTCMESVLAYVLLKVFDYDLPVGWLQWEIGTVFMFFLLLKRLIERWFVKLYREAGRNSRAVTLVGSDSELLAVYEKLRNDSTLGYNILGYYGDESMAEMAEKNQGKNINKHSRWNQTLERLGSMEDFIQGMKQPDKLKLGEELYLCVSRRDSDLVRKISVFCDHRVIRFFYVPMSVESMGVNLKRELLDDMEIFTTYDNPLQNSVNKAIKRAFDIIMSSIFLIPTALMYNVLQGRMSIVGPRPHMLAHTEQYSQLIDKYMVRHFVKPGVTGWAQVTGYRGETKELWQME